MQKLKKGKLVKKELGSKSVPLHCHKHNRKNKSASLKECWKTGIELNFSLSHAVIPLILTFYFGGKNSKKMVVMLLLCNKSSIIYGLYCLCSQQHVHKNVCELNCCGGYKEGLLV